MFGKTCLFWHKVKNWRLNRQQDQHHERGGSSQGDEPPSKLVSKMVAQKTPDVEKDMLEEQPTYEKDDTVCKICDIDQESHERLIKHNQKYHENKSYFTCNDLRKGFHNIRWIQAPHGGTQS